MTPDLALQFVEGITLFGAIAAIGGGFFGAAIGGNNAFGFTGVLILLAFGLAVGTGSAVGFEYMAFGPLFGPHVAFAGGVAASAYAAQKGLLNDSGYGKDVNQPLMGLGRTDVLLVGAVFGLGGYIFQKLVAMIPWFGTHTDSVAFTVFCSGILSRIIFSKKSPFEWVSTLQDDRRWLIWQEKPSQYLPLGLFSGLLAAGVSLAMVHYVYQAKPEVFDVIFANAQALPFAISAICIFLVALGVKMPVTHHMTIIAALSAVKFLPIVGWNFYVALAIGVLFGVLAAFVAEVIARLCYDAGDTHIDPPAGAIWPCTTLVLGLAFFLG